MRIHLNYGHIIRSSNLFRRDYKISNILFQDVPKGKKPRETSTSKVLSRKPDDIAKNKTLSRDTPYKVHPQKSDDEIEVHNIIAMYVTHF